MAHRLRRKTHSAHEHKCPHCIEPEKWCKNLSGLTQHINSVHLELFQGCTSSSVKATSLSPDVQNPQLSSSPILAFNDNDDDSLLPLLEQPDPDFDSLDAPGHTEYHPILTGLPCDANGVYLPPEAPAPVRTDAAADDWSPYTNRLEFELAEFLFKRTQMPQSNITTLMDLWAADVIRFGGRPPFADHVDLYRTIDATEHGDVPWCCFKVRYTGPRPADTVPLWMDETYEVWYRDPRKVAIKMMADPTLTGHFDTIAYRQWTVGGERRFGDLMSANWAWNQSDLIAADIPTSDGAMFTPIILGSDKTTVSVATGQNDYYPLYMSLGNLHNTVRRAHRDSVLPIAFLAIPKAERRYSDTTIFRRFCRQLFQTSLTAILQPLKPGMYHPEVIRCPDGHYRRVVWGIGPYIADYPEQVLVANIVQGWCAACLKYPDRLDTPEPGARRSRVHTEALLQTFERSTLWKDYGVVADVTPFTAHFPRANINELVSGDLLHQVIKGTFKDHLVTWIGEYLTLTHGEARGKEYLDEIDRRLAATPPFPGLRHFKQGRDFKQWTGDDSKALMKFCYLARRSVISESTLARMELARLLFHEHRVIFKDSGVRPDGFSLPRQHSLDHYPQHIRNFGAPNGLCTSITEAKHIKAVKEPWQRSNREDSDEERLTHLQHAPPVPELPEEDPPDEPEELDGVVEGPRVSGFVVLAQKPSLESLAIHVGIPRLPMLAARFISERAQSPDDPPVLDADLPPPDCVDRVHVFHSAVATFYVPSDPSGVGGMHREHIRATLSWRKGPPRYDCVFIGKDPTARGFRSLHVARVKLFIALRVNQCFSPSGETEDVSCAVVEWVSPVGDDPDPDSGLWLVEPDLDADSARVLGIVDIETLLRSAHLIPAYGDDPIPPYLKSTDSLDAFRAYYVNKYADHHAHEIAF
ncbi:hypothetical protein BC628DRAFT_1412796 [Trametes gibbosa]|nr:hypothetical protein BC628DRAFT_1412796 [Trametes gibbosa]